MQLPPMGKIHFFHKNTILPKAKMAAIQQTHVLPVSSFPLKLSHSQTTRLDFHSQMSHIQGKMIIFNQWYVHIIVCCIHQLTWLIWDWKSVWG